jgi:hypothetical protein
MKSRQIWSVERLGRLICGASLLMFGGLTFVHPAWLIGTLLCAANLVITSITDRCALRALLLRLGAREREDLFLPGGAPRAKSSINSEAQAHAVRPDRDVQQRDVQVAR